MDAQFTFKIYCLVFGRAWGEFQYNYPVKMPNSFLVQIYFVIDNFQC